MRRYIFKSAVILLIISFVSNAFAKETHISLKPDTLISPNRKFYIQNVIDSRPDTSNIGFAQDPTWVTKRIAKFEKGFSKELLDYYTTTLPSQKGQQPIIMEFRQLRIMQTFNAFAFQPKIKNSITSDILFYTLQDSIPTIYYETTFNLENTGVSDVSKSIKELLMMSLNSYLINGWQDTLQIVTYPKKEVVQKEEKPIFKNKYLNAATYFAICCVIAYVYLGVTLLATKGN
jgi:hypothetical protein